MNALGAIGKAQGAIVHADDGASLLSADCECGAVVDLGKRPTLTDIMQAVLAHIVESHGGEQ